MVYQEINYPHELATAHVIIKCQAGFEKKVIENLDKIEGIVNISRTIGEFDIFARVEAIDYETLKRLIRWRIRKNDHIESITTLICIKRSLCSIME
jgi:DNA-binding Lrp family transcriptional regulator